MKKVMLFIVLILLAFSIYWFVLKNKKSSPSEPKQASITLKTHSDSFNLKVDKAISSYMGMKDAFVESDTAAVKRFALQFMADLDSIPLSELKNDTAMIFETAQANVADILSNTQSLISQQGIDEMRKDFSMVTEMMYPSFFKTINYEGDVIYLQHCPMAFDDEIGANWLSESDEIMNPYLGKVHPKYKAGMLHCGEVKDSIRKQ